MPAASALRAEKVIAERNRGAHPCVAQLMHLRGEENHPCDCTRTGRRRRKVAADAFVPFFFPQTPFLPSAFPRMLALIRCFTATCVQRYVRSREPRLPP